MEDFRSLKLLNLIVRFARLARQTGLSLNQGTALYNRIDEVDKSVITALFRLNDLRQLAGHKADASRRARIGEALESLGVSLSGYTGRLGLALDEIYDSVADTMERVAATLRGT